MTIKTKRAARSVPAEASDGKRLLIVLKPSSAWRQGIPYDKPHVSELAPDDALFDKYEKNIKYTNGLKKNGKDMKKHLES